MSIGFRAPGDEVLSGYELIAPIGSGGFGDVWKCSAPGGLQKAIKFVFGNLNSTNDSAKAEQELKAMHRMKEVRHPFVLSIERIDNVGGELLIVMELAEKSLHDCWTDAQQAGQPGLAKATLLSYLSDAAAGLDYLIEKHNLQHLDVKPKNLFVVGDRVKVADFGLVKHLERHSSSGLMGGVTPMYAAPETFANRISKHSDQYSLAVVYIELLTGQKPFTGKNIRQLALQHMTEPPDLSMLSAVERPIVAKALAKNPDERFPNCSAFVSELINVNFDNNQVRTPRPLHSTPKPRGSRETPLPQRPVFKNVPVEPQQTMTVTRFEVGILRPAVMIGVGHFGRKAIQQIRCRLLDRVGDLHQVPSFRFLYLDVDPDISDRLLADKSDAAILPEQLVQLPLQQVNNYRRKHLDPILEWLPREKLYSMPRSLMTDGSRALGRLAFCDNYLKFATRLKAEIHTAIHPEAIKQSADQTGLAPREKQPAIYVFASATGGTSGFLMDLGHTIRRVLAKFNMADAPVVTFVFCGSPDDPSTPQPELANIYATLTEMNHYGDPDVPFSARYSGDSGPRIEAHGLPYSATYLLPTAQRTIEGLRDCISHLSGYITQELTTPLGLGLDSIRSRKPAPGRTHFRGFGTFGVWYPHGLLLRSAARQLCLGLVKMWSQMHVPQLPPELERLVEDIYSDPRLAPEAVQRFILEESRTPTHGTPTETVGSWYTSLSEQLESVSRANGGIAWSSAVQEQLKDLIGFEPTSNSDSTFRRGRFSRLLDTGISNSCSAWMNEFQEQLRPVGEIHGPRFLSMLHVRQHIVSALNTAAITLERKFEEMVPRRQRAFEALQNAYETCQVEAGGGLKWFGNSQTRNLRTFLDKVKQFLDIRIAEDFSYATARFFRKLAAKLDDQYRDIQVANDQVIAMFRQLDAPAPKIGKSSWRSDYHDTHDTPEESVQQTIELTNTMRVVLPNGDDHLESAAAAMLNTITDEQLEKLYSILDKLVIEPRGGLVHLCKTNTDLYRGLCLPMIEQATAFLSGILPSQDVTQVELASRETTKGTTAQRIGHYLKLAAAQAPGPSSEEKTFVVVPSTPSGEQFALEVRNVAPKSITVSAQGHGTDLMFCREQGYLRPDDLMNLIEPCWDAYEEASLGVESSPHSRFDVLQWVPLATK